MAYAFAVGDEYQLSFCWVWGRCATVDDDQTALTAIMIFRLLYNKYPKSTSHTAGVHTPINSLKVKAWVGLITRRTSNCQVSPLPVMSSDLSSRRLEVTICHTEAIISIFKPFTILKKYTEVLKTVNILLRMYSHHLLSSHFYLARRSSHTPSGRLAHGFWYLIKQAGRSDRIIELL